MAKRQLEIAGMERKSVKEIDDAGEEYRKQRNKRMKASKEEKASKVALIAVMRTHKVTVYRDDEADPPFVVTLSSKDDVKLTDAQDDEEEAEGDEPDDKN